MFCPFENFPGAFFSREKKNNTKGEIAPKLGFDAYPFQPGIYSLPIPEKISKFTSEDCTGRLFFYTLLNQILTFSFFSCVVGKCSRDVPSLALELICFTKL